MPLPIPNCSTQVKTIAHTASERRIQRLSRRKSAVPNLNEHSLVNSSHREFVQLRHRIHDFATA